MSFAPSDSSPFLVIGHRGLPKLAPENSGSGFKLAVELGIPMVELDVRMTRDKELVVIHDNDIKRVSDGRGKIHQKDFRFLRQFDYGSSFNWRFKGEKLITLEEALLILLPKVRVMIELKEDKKRRREVAEELVKLLSKREILLSEIIVCSFSEKLLLEIKRMNPFIRLGLIFRTKPKQLLRKAFNYGFNSVHPYHGVAKKPLIKWALSHGLHVYIWTVNSFKSIKKWKTNGVQGVITDIPERVYRLL